MKKKQKKCQHDPYAALVRTPLFRQRIVRDKTKYTRKRKHTDSDAGVFY
jgi:stalled ribosome alternative rescue factor ArfA